MEPKIKLSDDDYGRIVRRERNCLGYSPAVAEMSDVDVLRTGVSRTRRLMRRHVRDSPPAVARDAMRQFDETQLAFNRALDAAL